MDSKRIQHTVWMTKFLNIAAVTMAFAAGWLLYYNRVITWSYQYKGNLAICFLFVVLYCLFAKVYDAFALNVQRKMELAISQAFSAVFADAIMYVIFCLLYEWFAPIWPLLLVILSQFAIIILWVVLVKNWYFKASPAVVKVLLYDDEKNTSHLEKELRLENQRDTFFSYNIEDCLDMDLRPIENAEIIYLCARQGASRDAIVEYCTFRKKRLFILPGTSDVLISSAKQIHLMHMLMLQLHVSEPSPEYRFVKRAMDIALSLIALLILWPVMLLLALIIRVYDGGPAFYKQTRLTQGGKEFKLIKFRSMRVDAEADGVARLSTGDNDDRITPVGKVLRKLRLDELPQIFNILAGTMSVVGPRPERPEIAAEYEESLPEFRLRLQAKAGLTGYAQVYGKYNSTPREKLQMDMIYISNPSIIEDIKLILTTLRVLFIKESTEGVGIDQTTAAK